MYSIYKRSLSEYRRKIIYVEYRIKIIRKENYWKNLLVQLSRKIYEKSYATFIQKSLVPNIRAAGFIGNLEIGRRYSDETVFHRVMEFENPTNTVRSITLTLTVTNGEETLRKVFIIYFQLT